MKLVIQNPEYFEPGYELTVHYMIGDADGDKDFSICFDNPDEDIFKLIEILDKLNGYTPKGYWGFAFESEQIQTAVEDGRITQEEADFIDWHSKNYNSICDDIIRDEYCDCREFLVYEGFDITYTDSLGITHPVEVILEDNEQTQKEQNA